jgi:hypothetical protein
VTTWGYFWIEEKNLGQPFSRAEADVPLTEVNKSTCFFWERCPHKDLKREPVQVVLKLPI